jgi:outer membrane protein TolC
VFGGVRREVEAADADLAAVAEEARNDALVTLLAEVARNYAEVRGLQRRLDVANSAVRVQEESVSLTEARLRRRASRVNWKLRRPGRCSNLAAPLCR